MRKIKYNKCRQIENQKKDKNGETVSGSKKAQTDNLKTYLANNEIVYDKAKMNGKYQVGSGRIVTVTHDNPFIDKEY